MAPPFSMPGRPSCPSQGAMMAPGPCHSCGPSVTLICRIWLYLNELLLFLWMNGNCFHSEDNEMSIITLTKRHNWLVWCLPVQERKSLKNLQDKHERSASWYSPDIQTGRCVPVCIVCALHCISYCHITFLHEECAWFCVCLSSVCVCVGGVNSRYPARIVDRPRSTAAQHVRLKENKMGPVPLRAITYTHTNTQTGEHTSTHHTHKKN